MDGTTTAEQLQPHGKNIPRRQSIPILYTKGTHYDVGFDVVILLMFLMDFSYYVLVRLKQSDSLDCAHKSNTKYV